MQIQLSEGSEIQIDINSEISLPDYMTKLDIEMLDKSVENKDDLIIAAGADPKDGKITLLTATGKVMIFDARSFHIPDGPAEPCNGGKQIHLMNVHNRWPGIYNGFEVDAIWMLQKSTSGFLGAKVETNYQDENHNS